MDANTQMDVSVNLWSFRTFIEDQSRIIQENDAFLLPDNYWALREGG